MILAIQREDFTIEQAFKLFANTTLEKLTSKDLAEGLNNLGVAMNSPSEADLLIARYDGDGDGKLSFWEFQNLFMPLDSQARDKLERRRYSGSDMHSDVKHLVQKIL